MNFARHAFFALSLAIGSTSGFAVSMNFSGQFRSEATLYNNLNLGNPETDPGLPRFKLL
jgi:hypothetical protein